MRIPDATLDLVRDQGYAIVEGFLSADELAAARVALFENFPSPEEYFADPSAHQHLVAHPFAGLRRFPFTGWPLYRLAFHPDLVDAAERFCGTAELDLYKIELWAKYGGAVDFDQTLHRDYGNHNLVVPRADGRWPQMTTFTLLSDVDEGDGPTRVVPKAAAEHIGLSRNFLEAGDLAEHEVAVTGPAGSLFIYTTDIFHRGSSMTGHERSRFVLLADFKARGPTWMGRSAWPDTALQPEWDEILGCSSPRERELFGFPPLGHEYWNEQTLDDVAGRWPRIDMQPYRDASGA